MAVSRDASPWLRRDASRRPHRYRVRNLFDSEAHVESLPGSASEQEDRYPCERSRVRSESQAASEDVAARGSSPSAGMDCASGGCCSPGEFRCASEAPGSEVVLNEFEASVSGPGSAQKPRILTRSQDTLRQDIAAAP